MNVLMLTNDFPPVIGGIQTFSYETAKNFSRLGENVLVLAPMDNGWEEIDKNLYFKTIRMNLPFSNYLKILIMLAYLAYHSLKFKPDIIFSTAWFPCGVPVYIFNKLYGIPYIIPTYALELLTPPEQSIQKNIMVKVLNCADKIMPISTYSRDILLKMGIDANLISIIPVGVNISDYDIDNSSSIIKKYNLENKKIILTVSTLIYPYKGHDRVIKALPKVLKKIKNAVYIIVGEGPLRSNIENIVEDLQLKEYVIFAGHVANDDLPSYYHACDIFVMPSSEDRSKGHVEGFGIVYLEANACGKPVIAGRCGGALDAVVDGETGLLVDPLNIDNIADSIIRLLSDDDFAKKLGKNGQERVRKQFDWGYIACMQMKVISDIIARKGTKESKGI